MKRILVFATVLYLAIGLSACQTIAAPSNLPSRAPAARGGTDFGSSGGYAPNTQFNPWALKNTQRFTYCIESDEANFGLDLATARKGVREAIQFWQTEFQLSRLRLDSESTKYETYAEVGTQNFVETSCQESTDLHIQLGFLTPEQKSKITKISNYLALTVRTNYDPVQLKGQGFMYFSPVRGPLSSKVSDFNEKRWRMNNSIHFRILAIHEFGHIFGVTQHKLMSPSLMNYLKMVESGAFSEELLKGLRPSTLIEASLMPYEIRETGIDTRHPSDSIKLPGVGTVKRVRAYIESQKRPSTKLTVKLYYSTDGSKFLPYGTFEGVTNSTSVTYFGQVNFDEQQQVFKVAKGTSYLPAMEKEEQVKSEGLLKMAVPGFKPEGLAARVDVVGTDKVTFTVFSWKDDPRYRNHDEVLRFDSDEQILYQGFRPFQLP